MPPQPSEKIKTFCRVRPSKEERSENVVQIDGHRVTVKLKDDPKSFHFDECYGEGSSQEEVFNGAASRIVHGTLQGYNGTIFAYGQTGSGKTHTMIGPSNKYDKNSGIIPRGLHLLFEQLGKNTDEMPGTFTAKITISFVEIYNEHIYDLFLTNDEKLKIGQDSEGNAVVKGVTEIFVKDLNDAMEEVRRGWNNRSVAETAMNRSSSRSHALLLIKIRTEEVHESISTVRSAFLNLVDLAGSERVSQSKVEGERLKETTNINKSLLQLKIVIRELAEQKSGFISFRNSVLTHILKDSLGGNARTAVMINIHPNKQYYSETLATLQFASEVSRIENKVIVNEDLKGDSVAAFKAEINRLQEEKKMLKDENSSKMAELTRASEAWKEAAIKYERQLAVARRNAVNTAIIARKEGNAASFAENMWEKSMAEIEESVRKLPTGNIRSLQLKELTTQLELCVYEKDELQIQLDDERKAKNEVQEKLNSLMVGVMSPSRKNRRSMLDSTSSQSHVSSMLGNPLETSLVTKSSKKARRSEIYVPSMYRKRAFVEPIINEEGEEEEMDSTPMGDENYEERREMELEMKLNQKEQIVDEKTRECEHLDRLLKEAEKRISEAEEKWTNSFKVIEEAEKKVKELVEKLERTEKAIEDENEKVIDLERRASHLNEELIEVNAQVDSLQSDMELLKSTHQDDLKELERSMKTNLSDKEKKELDLKQEIDSLKGEMELMGQELTNKATEKKAANDILVMVTEDLKKIEKEKMTAINELEATKCQMNELLSMAMENAKKEREEERNKREAEHRKIVSSLEEKVDDMRKEMEKGQEKTNQMEASSSSVLKSLREEMKKMGITKEKELRKKDEEIRQLMKQLEEAMTGVELNTVKRRRLRDESPGMQGDEEEGKGEDGKSRIPQEEMDDYDSDDFFKREEKEGRRTERSYMRHNSKDLERLNFSKLASEINLDRITLKMKDEAKKKEKRKEVRKDTDCPKGPRTAYMLFVMSGRSRDEWRLLKSKTEWEKAAAEDKKRYDKELAVYNKSASPCYPDSTSVRIRGTGDSAQDGDTRPKPRSERQVPAVRRRDEGVLGPAPSSSTQ